MDGQRFDRFARALANGVRRRNLLAGLAGGLVGGLVSRRTAWPAAALPRDGVGFCMPFGDECACKPCSNHCCSNPGQCGCCECLFFRGIAGSGAVRSDPGVAHFNLFASSRSNLGVPDQPDAVQPIVSIQWRDPEINLTLESVLPVYYGPLEGVEGGREAIGWLQANGDGLYPYILQAVAAEPIGTGPETISLRVGDATLDDPAMARLDPGGFRYAVEGELVAGDLQLLTFDGNYPDDLITPATPTG